MGSNGWGTHELWLVLLFKANEQFLFHALAYLWIFFASMYIYVHIPEQRCVFWGIFLHISCSGEMDFGAQGYIVTDAAPLKPVKDWQSLIVSTTWRRKKK